MDKTLHSLYYSSLLSESPSIRDNTSRHANRFINSFEMSSMHLLPQQLINQSVFLNTTADETSVADNTLMAAEEDSSLTLYHQFFEANQKYSESEDNVFEMLTEFELLCCDHLIVTSNLMKSRVRHSVESKDMTKLENLFRLERNSWRVFRAMFEDRLKNDANNDEMTDISVALSDKTFVDRLFEREPRLREMQLVVDWLERNQLDDNEEVSKDRIQFYSEGPYYWENTLHALKTQLNDNERKTCPAMDPDAAIRSRLPLNDLDVEDESRLFRYIFQLLRSGQLPDAKDIAQRLGYHWLSAALDGWLLHNDPNYHSNGFKSSKVMEAVEGNANRDLWKYVCWRASKMEGTNVYERAIFAALSGNVATLLPLCTRWSDRLWAYFRSSLDVHIEFELRETAVSRPEAKPRFNVDLPDVYWDNKLTAGDVFREIESRGTVSAVVEESYHQNIQKFVILGDVDSLVNYVYDCAKAVTDKKSLSDTTFAHLLRFFAHLVLSLRQLKANTKRESLCVCILEFYIDFLISKHETELVAFYTSQLPAANQITAYAKLLERVYHEEDRKMCILLAKNANLDINAITMTVVDNVRVKAEEDTPMATELMNTTSGEDKKKINSLDWLLFSEVQEWSEALKQTNALMRSFLLCRKVDAMKEAFQKLPENIVDNVYRQCFRRTGGRELSAEDDNAVREYLCHKSYIQANDAFADWLYCLHNSKPREPPKQTSKRFMDSVAYEQSMKHFELEMNRWKDMLAQQARLTADKIENVLLFPDGGWMADQRSDARVDALRGHQMEELRRQYIPQLVFIAHSIHKSTDNSVECLKLADLVADERKAIYKTFSKELLIDLLKKLRETSIEVLNECSDPLGYPTL
ncbi:unnamed protein product [Medioppia subpectinata]|uniref:Nuclear pore complex protein n=1 Tax=Medioppia subpectinata TaxID=1979941 RepID=A0A7R9KJ14_9ACAR|nr:unnamed protein product [Medioppia subpectinata]CAG2104167.1 unnamed protein product [Medioppia subpectinata]